MMNKLNSLYKAIIIMLLVILSIVCIKIQTLSRQVNTLERNTKTHSITGGEIE